MTLPPSLAAWAPVLELFPEEIAPSLGPLIAALARLLGDLPAPPSAGQDEPAGYSGITRRGIPERLLLSEWLLAEELPEEFLRRASVREQGYLDLERHSPAMRRECRVLVDTGPQQAGAPRVAHLALMLVLGQRAQRAGASLRWGVLQTATGGNGVERSELLPLLGHRCPRLATPLDLTEWKKRWPAAEPSPEFWLVGGPAVRSLPHTGPRLILEDELHPKDLRLHLEYRPEQGPTTSLSLQMPDLQTCLRLLRWDQPVRRRPAKNEDSPALGVQWASNGLRLLVLTANGLRLHSFDHRGDRLEHTKTVRWFCQPGEQIVAMDHHWGKVLVVTRGSDGKLWLYGHGRPDRGARGPERWPLVPMDLVSAPEAPVRKVELPPDSREALLVGLNGQLLFRDGNDLLVSLEPATGAYWLANVCAEGVRAVRQVAGKAVVHRVDGADHLIETFLPGKQKRSMRVPEPVLGTTRTPQELLVYFPAEGGFQIWGEGPARDWARRDLKESPLPSEQTKVLATYSGVVAGGGPMIIGATPKGLIRRVPGKPEVPLRTEEIRQLSFCNVAPAVAWLGPTGVVVVAPLLYGRGDLGPSCPVEALG